MISEPMDRTSTQAPSPLPEKNLRAIRAALLPEDIGDFDRELRTVMAEATETLDLAPLTTFIERWWRWAWSSTNPAAHRRMLIQVARLNRGENVPTVSRTTATSRLSTQPVQNPSS